jgi:hypothetical protein
VGQRGADRNEGRQILVFCAQTVTDPCAHAGANKIVTAGVQLQSGSAVGRVGAVARVEKADVVHTASHMGKQFADRDSTLSVLPKAPWRSQQVAGWSKLDTWLGKGQRFAVILLQLWLVVEGVDLRGPTLHEHEDHAFRARLKVEWADAGVCCRHGMQQC